jgi:hypothetical protein
VLRFIVDACLAGAAFIGVAVANASGHWLIATCLTLWIAAIIWRNMAGQN